MRWQGLFLGLFLLVPGAGSARAEDDVRSAGDRVDIRVATAPLADVLDRLSRATGMKVVYDGPRPRQLVSVSIEQRTPVEAVLGLLEGTGVSFALQTDPSGTRCHTLFVVSTADRVSPGDRASATARNAPPASTPPPPILEELEASVPEEEFAPPPGMIVSPPQVVENPGEEKSPGGNSITFPPGFNTSPPNSQGGPPPTPPGAMPPNAPGGRRRPGNPVPETDL